jgi:chromosome segregation ATPase
VANISRSATLSVKIKNQGSAAYKPDIYGKSIIVQRHFSRTGTSGFKIQNENGKLISNKKSDLEDILDVFALQLDNPMNVLTQDMARQFLHNSTSSDKYKFFFKGTHLEQLDSDYRILEESVELNSHMLNNLKEASTATKRAFDTAEKKAERAKNHRNLTEIYRSYSRQMAWAQVAEQEKLLEDLENDIRDQDEVIQSREREAEESGTQLEAAEGAQERAKAKAAQLHEELIPRRDAKLQASENFNNKKKEVKDLHSEQRQINQALLTCRNAIQNLMQDIEKEEVKLRAADDGSHDQKHQEIEDAKDKLRELREEERAHASQSSRIDKAAYDAFEIVQAKQSPVQEKASDVKASERRLKDLAGDRSDWMRPYNPNLGKLLKAIESETRFQEKPVGPLGKHVALLKPEWSKILETCCGGMLFGFAVTTKNDQAILDGLMKRTG